MVSKCEKKKVAIPFYRGMTKWLLLLWQQICDPNNSYHTQSKGPCLRSRQKKKHKKTITHDTGVCKRWSSTGQKNKQCFIPFYLSVPPPRCLCMKNVFMNIVSERCVQAYTCTITPGRRRWRIFSRISFWSTSQVTVCSKYRMNGLPNLQGGKKLRHFKTFS